MSALMGAGGFLSTIKQIDTFPSTVLFFFNQSNTNQGDAIPFRQMTAGTDRWLAALLEANGVNTYAIHRNLGGSPSTYAVLGFPRSGGTWYAMRVRYHSATSRDVTIGPVSNFVANTDPAADDISLHDLTKLGESLNGMLAEVGIFNGRAVPDAEYTSYRSGTLLVETMTGVTLADPLLTFTNGATTRTALTGQVLTVNGTITQGSSHPIARTLPPTNLVVAAMAQASAISTGAAGYNAPVPGALFVAGMSGGSAIATVAVGYTPPLVYLTSDPFRQWGSAAALPGLTVPHTSVSALDGTFIGHVANAVTDGNGRLVFQHNAMVSGQTYIMSNWDTTGANRACKPYQAV